LTKHFERKKGNREGYFSKGKGNKTPNYKSIWKGDKTGFTGARKEVHHIVPQTSIDQATTEIKEREKLNYIKNVKWVTPWNINNANNLIGLPTVYTYIMKGDAIKNMSGDQWAKLNAWVSVIRRWSSSLRRKYLNDNGDPEGFPIHNPVSWGHTEYNQKVAKEIKKKVWDPLKEKAKKHQEEPEKVDAKMRKLSGRWRKKLEDHPGATVEKWVIKNRRGDRRWYKPFLMWDVKKSPLG
jgi:hypothetical protein